MRENWYALLLSITLNLTVEESFKRLRGSSEVKKEKPLKKKAIRYEKFGEEDIEKMIELKKSMSYKQIGCIFNTADRNIYEHIKSYKPELINTGIFKSTHKKSKEWTL